jgi:hypothetical protein
MEAIGTFDKAKNKVVMTGEVKNNLYIKKVNRSKHFLRIYGGYAIQKEILDELKDSITDIIIQEDTGVEYRITMENFIKRGFDIDFSHGKQTVVNEKYFTKKEKDQIYM